MLVDEVVIEVHAGKGGDGAAAFRREAYVPRGGPSGGDGGHGGDVILTVSPHMRTLVDFSYKPNYHAEHGRRGESKTKTGKSGKNLIVKVPPGTVIYDAETGAQVADLTRVGQKLIAARGGRGGRGNARFATAARQTPRFAEMGQAGDHWRLRLELRLLADVGIIGLPNAGKSTLISVVSAAKPKIASYPFTTLTPNLGVVKVDEDVSFILADMPGLIEGAASGAGLGDRFLRHIQRTRVLIHVVDVAGVEGRDPIDDFRTVAAELERFDPHLAELPQAVALNKMDLPQGQENLAACTTFFATLGLPCFPISAATTHGVKELMKYVSDLITPTLRAEVLAAELLAPETFTMPEPPVRPFEVTKADEGVYLVSGSEVEEMVARTDLGSPDGVMWLHERLEDAGVIDRLEDAGAVEGDTIIIGDVELEYSLQAGL
jgi:GTPase